MRTTSLEAWVAYGDTRYREIPLDLLSMAR